MREEVDVDGNGEGDRPWERRVVCEAMSNSRTARAMYEPTLAYMKPVNRGTPPMRKKLGSG